MLANEKFNARMKSEHQKTALVISSAEERRNVNLKLKYLERRLCVDFSMSSHVHGEQYSCGVMQITLTNERQRKGTDKSQDE